MMNDSEAIKLWAENLDKIIIEYRGVGYRFSSKNNKDILLPKKSVAIPEDMLNVVDMEKFNDPTLCCKFCKEAYNSMIGLSLFFGEKNNDKIGRKEQKELYDKENHIVIMRRIYMTFCVINNYAEEQNQHVVVEQYIDYSIHACEGHRLLIAHYLMFLYHIMDKSPTHIKFKDEETKACVLGYLEYRRNAILLSCFEKITGNSFTELFESIANMHFAWIATIPNLSFYKEKKANYLINFYQVIGHK